jgi:hypothetical protein
MLPSGRLRHPVFVTWHNGSARLLVDAVGRPARRNESGAVHSGDFREP